MLLGLVAVNAHIFSMEKEQKPAQQSIQARLSKTDMAKITIASVCCAFFGWAALIMYPLRESNKHDFKLINAPSVIMGTLFYLRSDLLFNSSNKDDEMNKSMVLGGITSGILACGLGAYVYKKLSVLRSNKSLQEKK